MAFTVGELAKLTGVTVRALHHDEIAAVLDDPALAAAIRHEEGTTMTEHDVKALFDGFDPAEHAAEAEARWGNSDAYKESARRTRRYGAAEWAAIRAGADAIYARFAELMRANAPPGDARAGDAVLAHREHLTRWFTANLDKVALGLAPYMRDAIYSFTGIQKSRG